MGLSCRDGGVATVPGLKLVYRSRLCERPDAIPPGLMILSEWGRLCLYLFGPAGERPSDKGKGRQGNTHVWSGPVVRAASQRPHYNQLGPNERELKTCNLWLAGVALRRNSNWPKRR